MTLAAPPTAGTRVGEFIETFCRNSKGDSAGELIELRPWQQEIVDELFVLRADGRRKHRTAYIGLPRKNGKSTIGAALALYGLIADGEPGAEVYSCAGDRQQASIVFAEAKRMVEADPELSSIVKVQRFHLEVPSTGSIYRVLSADAKLQQGLNPSMVVFDEVHVQPNRDLWDAMTLGRGARSQPLVVGITTAGFDRDSLAWHLHEHGRRVRSGEEDDPTFYYWWSEPSEILADWRDPKVWAEANPALDDFLFLEALEEDARITPESSFRRYHLNQWTATYAAWLPHGAWASIESSRAIPRDSKVVLSFDGAWTGDSAALLATTVEEVPHQQVINLWEKPHDDPYWQVQSEDVTAAVKLACQEYAVVEIACDPHEWRREIQQWHNDRLPVIEWSTSSLERMIPACSAYYQAVVDKRITHDGDPRLARHIANAVLKEDHRGARIVKAADRQKIDLAVTAVMGYDRAAMHYGKPVRKPRRMVTV